MIEINKHPQISIVFKDKEELLKAIKDLEKVLKNLEGDTPSRFIFDGDNYFFEITVEGIRNPLALPSAKFLRD